MPRNVLSLLVALGATVVGSLILWFGGALALGSLDVTGEGASAAAVGPAFLALLGAAGLGVAGYSIRWSPLGALVTGALQLVVSAVALAFAPYDENALPFLWRLVFDLDQVSNELSSGVALTLAFGLSALLGMALLVGGLAALRPRATSTGWRWLGVLGGVAAVVLAVAALAAGLRVYVAFLVTGSPDASVIVPQVVQLTLLVLAFGVALLPLVRTTVGAWIAGVVLTGLGLLLIAPLPEILAALPSDVAFLIAVTGPAGLLAAVGLTVVGLAAGSRLRRRDVLAGAGVG